MRYRSAPLLAPTHEVDHGSSAGVAPPAAGRNERSKSPDYAYALESGDVLTGGHCRALADDEKGAPVRILA